MASVKMQLMSINDKDKLIKWLINCYYEHTNKIYGEDDAISYYELQAIKEKADVLMNNETH